MRVLAVIFALAVTVVWTAPGLPQSDDQVRVAADPPSTIAFASFSEAWATLSARDAFVEAASPFDRSVRMQSDRPISEMEFRRFLGAQARAWSPSETARLMPVLRDVAADLRDLAVPLPPRILLVKTSDQLDNAMPHTRGAAVMLSEAILTTAEPSMLRLVLVHEIFHLLSRHNPDLRERLYSLAGFRRCEGLSIPEALRSRAITNPDAPWISHFVEVEHRGARIAVVPLTVSLDRFYGAGDTRGPQGHLNIRLLQVDVRGGQCRPAASAALLLPTEVSAFAEAVGEDISRISHPEEMLAGNFVHAVLGTAGLPDPRLPTRIRALLFRTPTPEVAAARLPMPDAEQLRLMAVGRAFNSREYALAEALASAFVADILGNPARLTANLSTRAHLDVLHVCGLLAESRFHLGRTDGAIAAYEQAIPIIERLHNVERQRFALVYARLGILYSGRGRHAEAAASVEEALRLAPQNLEVNILLGEVLAEQGDRDRARDHFRGLLSTSMLNRDERAVVRAKLDRLESGRPGHSAQPPDLTNLAVHQGLSIELVPINEPPALVSLPAVCALLESKWLLPCEVLAPIAVAEAGVLDPVRRQYDGDRVLAALGAWAAARGPRRTLVVAITPRDLFSAGMNYVFSWQQQRGLLGVISTHRFTADLDDFYEPHLVATRRVAIQALSTTGSMMGFMRPTRLDCPLAYPNDLRQFQLKASALCDSTITQRDALLREVAGPSVPVTPERRAEIEKVYRAYYFE